MCMPVRVKNVPPKSGTDDQGFPEVVILLSIRWVHSIPCSTVNAAPKNIVASSQFRTQGLSPRLAAITASTIVSELDSRHAVMMVAFRMLSALKGVGQSGFEMRP